MLNHGKMNLFFVIGSNHFHDQSNRQGIIQILRKKGFAITEVKQSISCNHSAEEKDNPCNFQPYPSTDEKDTQEEELLGSSKKSYKSENNEIVHNTPMKTIHTSSPMPYPSSTDVEKDTQEEELLGSSKKSYKSENNEIVHNTPMKTIHTSSPMPYPSSTDVEKDTQEKELLGSSKKSYKSESNEMVHNTPMKTTHTSSPIHLQT